MALSESAVIEVNNILILSDSYRMNQREIDLLAKEGVDPVTQCEYYSTAYSVLWERGKTDPTIPHSLKMISTLATVDGCDLPDNNPDPVDIDLPYYGGGL